MRKIILYSFVMLTAISFLMPLFLTSKVYADENLFEPTSTILEYTTFEVPYSGLTLNTCYVFKLYNFATEQYIPPSPNRIVPSCYKGKDIVYESFSPPIKSDGSLLIEGLRAGKYSFSLHKQECGLLGINCSLTPLRNIDFNVEPGSTPTSTPSAIPGGNICNIGYQSPDATGNCASCIMSQDPSLISKIRSLNTDFNSCNDQQLINYWCNGGIGKEAKQQCEIIKNFTCNYLCYPSLAIGSRTPTPTFPSLPCLEGKDKYGKITSIRSEIVECTKLETAVGNIPTDPAGLVTFVLKLILGLSGGIALILIIVGGYQMMTSQGNPERLQGARETITSAIVGLLFIIFSFLLLEIIGVDILQIPGFGK